MNYHDKKRVQKLIDDLLAFHATAGEIERIAMEGQHLNGMLVDYQGEIPQSSDYKVDGVSIKADHCPDITRDMINAHRVMRHLIETSKTRRDGRIQYLAIMTWPKVRRQYNEATGETWRQEDIAAMLWMGLDVYLEYRERACNRLIQIDRRMNQMQKSA